MSNNQYEVLIEIEEKEGDKQEGSNAEKEIGSNVVRNYNATDNIKE